MDLQTVCLCPEHGPQFFFIDIQRRYRIAVQVQGGDCAHVHAGLGVFEGNSENGNIQLFADDRRRLIINGGDVLVLGLGHAVFVTDLHFQRPVSVQDSVVEVLSFLFCRDLHVVQLDAELAGLQASAGLDGKIYGLIVARILDHKSEVGARGHIKEDGHIDEDKGDQIPEDALHLFLLSARGAPSVRSAAPAGPAFPHFVRSLFVNDKIFMLHAHSPLLILICPASLILSKLKHVFNIVVSRKKL